MKMGGQPPSHNLSQNLTQKKCCATPTNIVGGQELPKRRKRHSRPPEYSTYFVRCRKYRWEANAPSHDFSRTLTWKKCCATPINIVGGQKNRPNVASTILNHQHIPHILRGKGSQIAGFATLIKIRNKSRFERSRPISQQKLSSNKKVEWHSSMF
jgi:hypothetical protein